MRCALCFFRSTISSGNGNEAGVYGVGGRWILPLFPAVGEPAYRLKIHRLGRRNRGVYSSVGGLITKKADSDNLRSALPLFDTTKNLH